MSINSLGSGLQSYLQGLSSTASAAAATAAANTTATGSNASSSGVVSGTTGTHHSHHARSGMKAIQNAVSQALEQAQTSGTTEDPNKIVEDAIAKVFKHGLTSPDQTSAAETLTGKTEDDNSAGDFPDATTSTFLQTLQSFGVSPQQFQNDFTAAVKDAQNGSANLATALQSFPPGSALDVWG